jgi:hypothetical protein
MAAAPNLEGMYGVRGELNARGIENDRIGWNQNTGYVTVDGKNFLKPATNNNGTTYADPTAFDQAYNVWGAQGKLDTVQKGVDQQITQPVVNPWDTKVGGAIDDYYNKISNPTPYDPYSSPEFAAYQAQAQRNAQQGIRSAQESMGAAGFGRSTNLAERAQGIQNDANEYLQLQVVPQLTAANQAQQQQEIANLGAYLGVLTGQQGMFDTRTQQGLQNTLQYMGFLSDQRNTYSNEQYQTGRDTVQDNQWQQNYDRGVFENDRTFNEGVRQFDTTFDRNMFENDRAYEMEKEKFAENVRQFGVNVALEKASQAISRSNAGTSASNANHNRLMDVWKATGRAPAGISGVPEGTPYSDGGSGSAVEYDYRKDPNFSEGIAWVNGDPVGALKELRQDAKSIIDELGYQAYQELLKAAEAQQPDEDPFAQWMVPTK